MMSRTASSPYARLTVGIVTVLTLSLPLFFPEDIDETPCSHMIDPYYIVVYCIFEIHIIPYQFI